VGRVGGGWYQPPRESRLTPDERRSHLALWVLLAAPLLLGCDVTQLDHATLELLRNEEAIAINQDPLGRQAYRMGDRGSFEVWRKDLAGGSTAIGVFARGDGGRVGIDWGSFGIEQPHRVRDVWARRDVPAEPGLDVSLPRHGSVLLRLSPVSDEVHEASAVSGADGVHSSSPM
jgi:alpha-galactosidase